MRIAFLDESGRSAPEKIIVVAGIVDRSYRKIEEALRQLVADTIPIGDRDGFLFHATDLFASSMAIGISSHERHGRTNDAIPY